MSEKLKTANINANKKIAENNIIYQQSNSNFNENIVSSNDCARRFYDNIEKMKSPHKSGVTSSEEFGSIEDYSEYQEGKDLKNYKSFVNSFAFDDIKEAEFDIVPQKKITLYYIRKIGAQHDD